MRASSRTEALFVLVPLALAACSAGNDGAGAGALGSASDAAVAADTSLGQEAGRGSPLDGAADVSVTPDATPGVPVSSSLDAAADVAPSGSSDANVADADLDAGLVDASLDAALVLTTCNGAGVDTQTDAHNCGRCGHACDQQTCEFGRCVSTAFEHVTYPEFALPTAVAVADTHVYWGQIGSIKRAPSYLDGAHDAGGGIETLADASYVVDMVVDEASVYWVATDTDGGRGIHRVAKDGGGGGGDSGAAVATFVASSTTSSIAVDATTLYWTTDGALNAQPKGGGPTTVLASSPGENLDPVVAGNKVYWLALGASATEVSTAPATSKVMAVPRAGGAAAVVATNPGHDCLNTTTGVVRHFVTADTANVYWAVSDRVLRIPLDGTPPSALALISDGTNGCPTVAADASGVYLATSRLARVLPVAGATGPAGIDELYQANVSPPPAIALSAGSVFWPIYQSFGTSAGAIVRYSK